MATPLSAPLGGTLTSDISPSSVKPTGSTFYYLIADIAALALGGGGSSGARGSLWITGTGAPGVIAGSQAGDQYLDGATGNTYQLQAGGAWTLTGNIRGLTGAAGAQGVAGANGAIGPAGPAGSAAVPWTPFPAGIAGVITLTFPSSGNIAYYGTLTSGVTFAITGGSTTQRQEMVVAVTENSTGSFVYSFPAPPEILWPGGGALQLTAATFVANQRSVFKISTTPTANIYDGSY